LRQLAFPHRYQQVTCPPPVSCKLPLASSVQVVGLWVLFKTTLKTPHLKLNLWTYVNATCFGTCYPSLAGSYLFTCLASLLASCKPALNGYNLYRSLEEMSLRALCRLQVGGCTVFTRCQW